MSPMWLNSSRLTSADGKDANRLLLKAAWLLQTGYMAASNWLLLPIGCCKQAARQLTDCMDASELHGCLDVYFFGKQSDVCV